MPKCEVAVVIPAYNAGDTINRALDSLRAQTIPIQIIVVDDGSEPPLVVNGGDVTLIRQSNEGGYAARRRGLEEVKTPYFGFMDADDYVEPDMYEQMLSVAKRHDLDVVQCDVFGAVDAGIQIAGDLKKEVFDPILIYGTLPAYVWNKLYRNRGIKLEPARLTLFDDYIMNLQLLWGIRNFAFLHKGLYHYVVNTGSSTQTFKIRNIEDFKVAITLRKKWIYRYLGEHDSEGNSDKWEAGNFWNIFIIAASGKYDTWASRMHSVRLLYNLCDRRWSVGIHILVFLVFLCRRARIAFRKCLWRGNKSQ